MRLNRKGESEGTPAIFYILFTSIMLIFSVVIIFALTSNVGVEGNYNLFNLRYNSLVARLIYSPNCLATEVPYSGDLGQKYQVYPAVIDIEKVKKKAYNDCIKGISCSHKSEKKDDYEFAISKLEQDSSGTYKFVYWDFSKKVFAGVKDNYCRSGLGWGRTGNFMVVINENGKYSPGVLTFCLKPLSTDMKFEYKPEVSE